MIIGLLLSITLIFNLTLYTFTTALPIEIKDARVEDNATAYHLEITFVNNGTTDLSNFDIYLNNFGWNWWKNNLNSYE